MEIKRRTRIVRLFPKAAPLLRPAFAVLCSINDDCENEPTSLNMESEEPALRIRGVRKKICLKARVAIHDCSQRSDRMRACS